MSDQKVAVVTGGASGIGKCIVEEFRKQGVRRDSLQERTSALTAA